MSDNHTIVFTEEMINAATAETERLSHELDISNADHVALWLESNISNSTLAWLAASITAAHEQAAMLSGKGEPPAQIISLCEIGLADLTILGNDKARGWKLRFSRLGAPG